MLEKIRLRKSLDQKIEVGNVIKYRTATFVIINILDIQVVDYETKQSIAVYDCLAQQYNTPDLSQEYTVMQTELCYDSNEFRQVSEVGDLIFDEETGIWVTINTILGVRFSDNKMYVTYEFTPIPEWSEQEMEKQMLKKRRSIMKLIKSKNNINESTGNK